MALSPSILTLPPQEQSVQPLLEIIYYIIRYFLDTYHIFKAPLRTSQCDCHIRIRGRCFSVLLNEADPYQSCRNRDWPDLAASI